LDGEKVFQHGFAMDELTKAAAGNLRALREQADLSQQQLAERLGWAQSAISKLEKGERRFDLAKIAQLAEALGVETARLTSGAHQAVDNPRVNKTSFREEPIKYRIASGQKGILPETKTLPVRGTTRDGEGRVFMNIPSMPAVDMTYRPPLLDAVEEAYGLFMFDDSMRPMYRATQTLWVHPHLPVVPGDGVVIQKVDGETSVKELVSVNDAAIVVREYKPAQREFEIPASEIATIHCIVGAYGR
jgi:phage repressor protein C with HTH and peptisase S24 domain